MAAVPSVGASGEERDEYQIAVLEVADHLESLVRGGMSIASAVSNLSSGFFKVPLTLLNDGRAEYERRRKIIQVWDDGEGADVVHGENDGGWYGGPKEGDFFWTPLRNRLKSELPSAFDDIDKSSSRVIDLGERPGVERIDTRGLVLGYVQSGKTTNFMSVIAKAADVGYRLIIVLSGITDNLRQQTQERLDDYLVGPCRTRIHLLTTEDQDFSEVTPSEALFSQDDLRLLAIVKKNPARLRRLNAWIKKASAATLSNCPILIIDDEADQASIDVGGKRQSTINRLIRELLSHPKSAYIAYTATPFANLLIDPADESGLYPKNYVVTLPRSDDYFGPERIFGTLEAEEGVQPDDGLDIVREIPLEDVSVVKPPTNKEQLEEWKAAVPSTLRRAIQWFLLATTARRVRAGEDRHSSMLVHTSMRAAAHRATKTSIEITLEDIRSRIHDRDPAILREMLQLWNSEAPKVDATAFGNASISADVLISALPKTLDSTKVVMDNYLSDSRLKYTKGDAQTVIVVGGNTLSRGLTLEGLISSYFVRAASAYDTLLQMGRWFGYRKGYEDLVRVWMTTELREWFIALATVEAEIRLEIDTYAKENKSPSQLPIRIRSHPQMAITAAAKMRSALKVSVSYSGTKVQTILFRENDKNWLKSNISAVERLVSSLRSSGHHEDELPSKRTRGFTNVPNDLVLTFLNEYSIHEDARTINAATVREYIQVQADKGSIDSWNVVFIERRNAEESDISVGLDRPLRLLRRRKMSTGSHIGVANLKAISSRWDRFADLEYSKKSISDSYGFDDESRVRDSHLRDLRKRRGLDKVGLLVIYPINKNSDDYSGNTKMNITPHADAPTDDSKSERVTLNAADHLIGISLMFPEARTSSDTVDYYSARIDPGEIEDTEAELAAADELDEKRAAMEEASAK